MVKRKLSFDNSMEVLIKVKLKTISEKLAQNVFVEIK